MTVVDSNFMDMVSEVTNTKLIEPLYEQSRLNMT